jgi:hypothetical protein
LATGFEFFQKIVVGYWLLTLPRFKVREVCDIFFEGDPHGIVHEIRNAPVGLERFDPQRSVEVFLQVDGGSFHAVTNSG